MDLCSEHNITHRFTIITYITLITIILNFAILFISINKNMQVYFYQQKNLANASTALHFKSQLSCQCLVG